MPADGSAGIFTGTAELTSNIRLTPVYHLVRLACDTEMPAACPGQFVMIRLRGAGAPLLGRPFAVFDSPSSRSRTIDILYAVVGRGTAMLRDLAPGAAVQLTGPLGNSFEAVEGAELHLVVGGGTGLASVVRLARELAGAGHGRTVFVCGSRDADGQLPEEMRRDWDFEFVPATEDGSLGLHGTAMDAVVSVLDRAPEASAAIYSAGPAGMQKAIARFAASRSIPCRVSLEERMACGMGYCRGCVIRATTPDPATGLKTRTVCKDGPVFDASEVDWEALP